MAGLIHINMRLPVHIAIKNGWLDVEDLISVGIALQWAWIVLLSAVGILLISGGIEVLILKIPYHKIHSSMSKERLGPLAAVSTLIVSIAIVFSIANFFFPKGYTLPYAGVVTRSKVIYGTVPQLKAYQGFTEIKTAIVHLITLNNWVIFQYREDVIETEKEIKKREQASPMNWGNLKNGGYITFPIASIDSIFLEERIE